MAYSPFTEKFPDLKENRFLTTQNNPLLPDDKYEFCETYCNEIDCDCQRVILLIGSIKQNKIVATIAFGWEKRRFYEDWLGTKEPFIIDELMGPTLELGGIQSKIAPQLLKTTKELILQDKSYVDRLKRHYQMFKATLLEEKKSITPATALPKIGCNEPCICGSGKKYKYCCLAKNNSTFSIQL